MKFDDALSLYEILSKTVPGTEIGGLLIRFVFVGPSDTEKLTEFLQLQLREGKNAIYHYMNDELSVYGSSEQKEGRVPRIEVVVLDYMRLEILN